MTASFDTASDARSRLVQVKYLEIGSVKASLLIPHMHRGALIVYAHGGRGTAETLDSYLPFGHAMASYSECAVLMVDYRRTTRRPFPTAVNDVETAVKWAQEHGSKTMGLRPGPIPLPILIAGDGIGASIAIVIATRLRNVRPSQFVAQIMLCPNTDGCASPVTSQTSESKGANACDPNGLMPAPNHDIPALLYDALPSKTSFAGLPPTFLATAGFDPLRDVGHAYAARLAEAGVDITFRQFHTEDHGFAKLVGQTPSAAKVIAYIARFMDEVLTQ